MIKRLSRKLFTRLCKRWLLLSACVEVYQKRETLRESIEEGLPIMKRTFWWQFIVEFVLVLQVFPLKILIDWMSEKYKGPYLIIPPLTVLIIYFIGTKIYSRMDNPRNDVDHWFKFAAWGEAHEVQQALSADFHTKHGTGEREAIIAKNLIKLEQVFGTALFDIVPVLFRITCTTIASFIFGWEFGFIALLTFIAYFGVLQHHHHVMFAMTQEYAAEQKLLDEFGSELTAMWRLIKMLGIEEKMTQHNRDMLRAHWVGEGPRHFEWRKRLEYLEHVLTISRALLMGACIYKYYFFDSITSGTASLIITWMALAYSNYGRLSNFLRLLARGKKALQELVEIFLLTPLVRQSENPLWPTILKGKIEIQNLSFAYPLNPDRLVLKGITLTIEPQSMVAFVGKTGSGKSTLAALIERLYDPTTGSILIDGIDLRELDYKRFRQSIGVVSQLTQLFNGTIRENMLHGNADATDEQIIDALKKAQCWEFICKYPGETESQKLSTMIGENGIRLSGGQRQRLAIARALVRGPFLLILDEATSALDAESQILVTRAIDNLINNHAMTVIVIAHRFSTIKRADIVVVLDDASIEAIGTHEELLTKSKTYRRLRKLELDSTDENDQQTETTLAAPVT